MLLLLVFYLTPVLKYAYTIGVMKIHSTSQVAQIVGVHKQTLLRWLYAGVVKEPKRRTNGGVDARIWTDRDVEGVRKYKQENYRKGRGRKPKSNR
jgi:hypothetical protein